jgi:hypothetical protein
MYLLAIKYIIKDGVVEILEIYSPNSNTNANKGEKKNTDNLRRMKQQGTPRERKDNL